MTRCRVGLLATTALLLGGDTVELSVRVGPGATLDLFDVAATVGYHGRGRRAWWSVSLVVEAGGTLVWSGEPLVVADGADVERTLTLDVADSARALVHDGLVLGRAGERGGRVLSRTSVSLGGRPVLREDQLLDPADRGDPGLLGAFRVIDTVTAIGVPPGAATAIPSYALPGGVGTVQRHLGSQTADSPVAAAWPGWRRAVIG